jgi:hypothetical protein
MPQKVTVLPKRHERLCPWCEKTYTLPPDHSGEFCPDCRNSLLNESPEFLVNVLGKAIGLNLVIMAAMPVPDSILEGVELKEKGSIRRMTMKEAADRYRPK